MDSPDSLHVFEGEDFREKQRDEIQMNWIENEAGVEIEVECVLKAVSTHWWVGFSKNPSHADFDVSIFLCQLTTSSEFHALLYFRAFTESTGYGMSNQF